MQISNIVNGRSTAEARWARYGPYYAMFPVEFAFDVIRKYSKKGDNIIDPFAGRCTSVYAGGVLERNAIGIEINPVGWLYGSVKLNPAPLQDVLQRLDFLCKYSHEYQQEADSLPQFYHMCYCNEVLCFLCAVRKILRWREDNVDATLMSIILIYLHGKIGEGISNQMRMTMSMGMNYSIEWWTRKNLLTPPQVDPYKFFKDTLLWRYAKGIPHVTKGTRVILGDSTKELQTLLNDTKKTGDKFSLLFTSPPYYAVTDYHIDQWLRLWMLGGSSVPKAEKDDHKGRFGNKQNYKELLENVFGKCYQLMAPQSTIYVRTDKREFTLDTTIEVLDKHFPDYERKILKKPITPGTRTQTQLYGKDFLSPGEVDIILRRK